MAQTTNQYKMNLTYLLAKCSRGMGQGHEYQGHGYQGIVTGRHHGQGYGHGPIPSADGQLTTLLLYRTPSSLPMP